MNGSGSLVALAEHHQEMAEALRLGRPLPAGRLLGLPELSHDDVWVDVAGAAALLGASPNTITSWLARKGPRRKPFPRPSRILYRLYWPRGVVEAWLRDAPG